MLPLLFIACGDKSDDTAAAASDSGTDTDTTVDTSTDLGDAPAAGVVVAEMVSGGYSATLVCSRAESGLRTEDTIVFNTLNHAESCEVTGSSGFLAINNLPTVSMTAYPGGSAEVEMEVESIAYRVYGSAATSFVVDVSSYDYASGVFVGTLWLKWPDAELKVWIDGQIGA